MIAVILTFILSVLGIVEITWWLDNFIYFKEDWWDSDQREMRKKWWAFIYNWIPYGITRAYAAFAIWAISSWTWFLIKLWLGWL